MRKNYRAAMKLRDRFDKYQDDMGSAMSVGGFGRPLTPNEILGLSESSSDRDFPWQFVRDWRGRVDRLLKICPNETGLIGDPFIMKPLQPEQPDPLPQNSTGNPVIKGQNIPGDSNRRPDSNRNVQHQNEDRAAPATTEVTKSKDRPQRNRQRDRCDRDQRQVPADCPDR